MRERVFSQQSFVVLHGCTRFPFDGMKQTMDDGEVELSDPVLLPNPDSSANSQSQTSTSIDSLLDEFLKNTRTCTHTHTCNPSGPNTTHTHTCYHTHTQVFQSEDDDAPQDTEPRGTKPKRPLGNREAVRKYREKKKAHTAFLEEEVKKLRASHQQLIRKLQGQAVLEAEVLRLRGLLMDLRGKIDGELGVCSFQKQCNTSATSFKEGDCGLQPNGGVTSFGCEKDMPCFYPRLDTPLQATSIGGSGKLMGSWQGNCQPPTIDCLANVNANANANVMACTERCTLDAMETLVSSSSQADQ